MQCVTVTMTAVDITRSESVGFLGYPELHTTQTYLDPQQPVLPSGLMTESWVVTPDCISLLELAFTFTIWVPFSTSSAHHKVLRNYHKFMVLLRVFFFNRTPICLHETYPNNANFIWRTIYIKRNYRIWTKSKGEIERVVFISYIYFHTILLMLSNWIHSISEKGSSCVL